MNRRIVIQNLFAAGSNSTWVETFSQPDSIQLKVDFKEEDRISNPVNEPALAKAPNGEVVVIAFTQSSKQSKKPAGIIYQFRVTL